jgi:pimeloyl-ACP methyl ester carboxylesterase
MGRLIRDDTIITCTQAATESGFTSSVIALHCSLSSGHQWSRLAEELTGKHQVITPDISGYGNNDVGRFLPPTTMAEEVDLLSDRLGEAKGPIHLVGHSYGGALAFKIATDSPVASRVRSLTLIEPVLPTILMESESDRRLYEHFVCLAQAVCKDLWKGSSSEAIEKFLVFWNGSGPTEQLSSKALVRMIEHAEKLAYEFLAILGERNVAVAAAAIRVPTLLVSGGLSPYLTQRVVGRLVSMIPGAKARHLPAAGHMLPISHAAIINPDIARHIARADEFANLSLVLGESAPQDDASVKIETAKGAAPVGPALVAPLREETARLAPESVSVL